jgi:Zn-dependent protease
VITNVASPAAPCPECGTQVATGLLTCPACHWLVHSERLTELAERAEAAARRGELGTAVALWQEAIPLVPAGSRQHNAITSKVSMLGREQAAAEDRATATSIAGAAWKWASGLGALGLLAWKFKFVLVFLLTKGKLLLLGLTKGSTVLSMLASLGVYWTQWGMLFALGLVLSIYVHEMGHVAALRRFGIPASAPMFIPGLGAVVRMHHAPAGPHEDARVGLAGPLWGLGAALAAYGWFAFSGNPMWAAIGRTGAWINLFNLLPIWQLDGSRGFAALTRAQRALALVAIGVAWVLTREGLLLLLGIVALIRVAGDRGAEHPDRGALAMYVSLTIALAFLSVMHRPA